MKKEGFERLKKSLEQAIADERGEVEAGRGAVQELLETIETVEGFSAGLRGAARGSHLKSSARRCGGNTAFRERRQPELEDRCKA